MILNEQVLRETDLELNERYSTRFEEFGDDARALGWDTQRNQYSRFAVATEMADFSNKSVLDVGCGLAHFRKFLADRRIHPHSYTGVDINPHLLGHCREVFPNDTFVQGNVLLDAFGNTTFDVVVAFGIVNFRFAKIDPADYAKQLLSKTFALTHDIVIVDALTAARDDSYPEEASVFYHDPCVWVRNGLALTPYVSLRHDYRSIPQREMMLALRKRAR